MEQKVLSGGKLAGGNPENGRVENDYYATNPKAVKSLYIRNKDNKFQLSGCGTLELTKNEITLFVKSIIEKYDLALG